MDDLEQKETSEDAIPVSQPAGSDTEELTEDDLEDVAGGFVWTPDNDSKWEQRW